MNNRLTAHVADVASATFDTYYHIVYATCIQIGCGHHGFQQCSGKAVGARDSKIYIAWWVTSIFRLHAILVGFDAHGNTDLLYRPFGAFAYWTSTRARKVGIFPLSFHCAIISMMARSH